MRLQDCGLSWPYVPKDDHFIHQCLMKFAGECEWKYEENNYLSWGVARALEAMILVLMEMWQRGGPAGRRGHSCPFLNLRFLVPESSWWGR